jgi:hypothetical protein
MGQNLDRCESLTDAQLDQELESKCPFPWNDSQDTLRKLLQASVGFGNPWLDTINGAQPTYDRETLGGLKTGLHLNQEEFKRMIAKIEEEGRWDLTFVDSLFEPPEVFSYVGVVGHVVTFNAYRRVLLISEIKKYSIDDVGFGDPLEFGPHRN